MDTLSGYFCVEVISPTRIVFVMYLFIQFNNTFYIFPTVRIESLCKGRCLCVLKPCVCLHTE